MNLAESVLTGSRLALSRLITQIENNTPEGLKALGTLFPNTGRAQLIGVTGAPGTGKSSLVNALARHYRHPPDGGTGASVAIVAVDPSSPFSGGALLGDRIRMRDLAGDPNVFIRSMASRGSLGGLARSTTGVVQALDAAGYDVILIETVGAGQAEVDIARLAHTTLVVDAPGLGDDIQAIKAGILEIADILVLNKADRPGVENTERALRNIFGLAKPAGHHFGRESVESHQPHNDGTWHIPIQKTVATEGTGIPELAELIARHKTYLIETGEWERRDQERLEKELENLLHLTLVKRFYSTLEAGKYQDVVSRLTSRSLSPHQAVAELLGDSDGNNGDRTG